MPEYLKRVGRDVTDDILVRVPESEKKVARQGGPATKRPSIDRGSIPSVAAPFEGQMMLQYADEAVGATPVSPDVGATFSGEQPYYYSNGEWRPFTSGIQLNAATEWLEVTATNIAGATTTLVGWSSVSGPSLVDLLTPTQPTVTTRGVYAVDIVVVADGATTTNWFQVSANMVQAAFSAPMFAQDVYSPSNAFGLEGSLSITGVMDVGDSFLINIFNRDNAARDFTCPSVRVTRILELP